MHSPMFRIQVYDKRNHPLELLYWVSSVLFLILVGFWFLLDYLDPPGPSINFHFIWPPMAILTGLRLLLLWHTSGPVGKVSELIVDDNSIRFLDTKVNISAIKKIVIILEDDRVQYSRSQNNYFEIKTVFGETYKFGILIHDSGDEKHIMGIVERLKSKIKDFSYEGYM
jgi:hypothetical protein